MKTPLPIYTIGHSNHSIEHILGVLQRHQITAVADVRSIPSSRFNPQFNQSPLIGSLKSVDMEYVFLGREMGARSSDTNCYVDGKVQYNMLAKSDAFLAGMRRLLHGRNSQRIAIMCSEQDPLDCHRTLLVARQLEERKVKVKHILSDGTLESHDAAMMRLRRSFDLAQSDLFHTEAELLAVALRLQEDRIAYVMTDHAGPEVGTV